MAGMPDSHNCQVGEMIVPFGLILENQIIGCRFRATDREVIVRAEELDTQSLII